jgi:hypothetical protein
MAKLCPLIREPCLEHGCEWYEHLIGVHPQTGEHIDKFRCAITLLPTLLIENSQQQRQTGAAVESLRNEVVEAKDRDQLIDAGRVLNGQALIR